MGVDWYACAHCGETFCDCGDYETCEGCGNHFCSKECAGGQFAGEFEPKPRAGGPYWEQYPQCRYCTLEDVSEYDLRMWVIGELGMSENEAIAKCLEEKRNG